MDISSKIEDGQIPVGVEVLGEEDLYSVPVELIELAAKIELDDQNDQYQWTNPRRYSETEKKAGRGFEKESMDELYNDIKEEGLMCSLICRWVISDTGEITIQVLDGERRMTCIKKQIANNEMVWSRKDQRWMPASKVYAKICCRIVTGNEKEALKIAFMVSDRSVSWGEGATAKLIKRLRSCKCGDDEILEITKKTGQWLREMDKICLLDELTFSYLTDGKINRALALKLTKVSNEDKRHKYLAAAYDDAVAEYEEIVAAADEAVTKAEEKEELAEAKVEEEKITGDENSLQEAISDLEEAKEKVEKKRKKRADAGTPRAKTKNLQSALQDTDEDENQEDESDNVEDDILQPLRPGKLKAHSEFLQTVMDNDCLDMEGKEILPQEICQVLKAYIDKCVLGGQEDLEKFLKRQKNILILQRRKMETIENEEESDIEDEVEV